MTITISSRGVSTRQLGQSGLSVSPIGLGCWQFAGGGTASAYWKSPPQSLIDDIVRVSLAGGINWFDTAEMYGFGRSEKAVASALVAAGQANGDIIMATKWLPVMRTTGSIVKTFHNREEFLAPFGVDLLQIHLPYSLSSVEGQMNALADLLEAGKIKAAGVSNFSADRMRRAHYALKRRGQALTSNQMRYSLLDRSIEKNGVLDAAKELGISIIAYSPLAQGLLSGKYHGDPGAVRGLPFLRRRTVGRRLEKSRPLVQKLAAIAASYGITPCQVALSWLINFHGEHVVAIPGATRVEQAADNSRSMGVVLTRVEMSLLDELSKPFA